MAPKIFSRPGAPVQAWRNITHLAGYLQYFPFSTRQGPGYRITKRTAAQSPVSSGRRPVGAAGHRGARRPRLPELHDWLLFPLSREHRHTSHNDECFVSQLLDATRLNALRDRLKAEIDKLKDRFPGYERTINDRMFRTSTRERRDLKIFYEIFGLLEDQMNTVIEGQHTDYRQDQELQERLRSTESALTHAMGQVYETGTAYCEPAVLQGLRTTIAVDCEFLEALRRTELCSSYRDMLAEELTKLVHEGGQADPATIRASRRRRLYELGFCRKRLQACRKGQIVRQGIFLRERAAPLFAEDLGLVYFATKHNMADLQRNSPPWNLPPRGGSDQSGHRSAASGGPERDGSSRRGSGSFDGHDPHSESGRNSSIHSGPFGSGNSEHSIGHSVSSHDTVDTQVRLARRLRVAEQHQMTCRKALDDIEDSYFAKLDSWLLTLPSSSRQTFDREREYEGHGMLEDGQALARLDKAEEAVEDTRRDMREYLNTLPAASESDFRNRTSDLNTDDAPFLLNEVTMYYSKWTTGTIRHWAGVAQAAFGNAALPDSPTTPLDVPDSARSSDLMSYAVGTIYSQGQLEHRQKWKRKWVEMNRNRHLEVHIDEVTDGFRPWKKQRQIIANNLWAEAEEEAY